MKNLLLELKNYEANQQQKGGRGVAPVSVAGEEEVVDYGWQKVYLSNKVGILINLMF